MPKPGTYDRQVKISDMIIGDDGQRFSEEDFKNVEQQYIVRLRPKDGTPVDQISDKDMHKHLLLTDRTTGKQFRVAGRKNNGVMSADGKDDISLDLYEVFEGDKFKPQPPAVKRAFGSEMLNDVWKESWRRPVLQPYRDLLRRAVPFILDDKATELTTELAMRPDKVALYRNLARLPYDAVWIELDHKVQVRHQIALGSNRAPHLPGEEGERIGYLIEKIGETRWRVTYWTQVLVTDDNVDQFRKTTAHTTLQPGDLAVDTMLPHFVMDSERPVTDYQVRVKDPFLRAAAQALAMEGDLGGIGWGLQSETETGRWGLQKSMFMAATVDLLPDWEHGLIQRHARPHERRDNMVKLMQVGTKELAGILRHVCCALAMINEVPLSIREVHHEGNFRADGRLRPWKPSRHVTINLPKAGITPKRILKLFAGAKRRMARHQVRGHWRRYWSGSKRDGTRVVQRKWIEHFERGDATLGYVLHDYEVKG